MTIKSGIFLEIGHACGLVYSHLTGNSNTGTIADRSAVLAPSDSTRVTTMQVQQRKLSSLLQDVRTGKLVIADFQRDFVWTRKQVEELLNSVINRYFIGTLLLLEDAIVRPHRTGVH